MSASAPGSSHGRILVADTASGAKTIQDIFGRDFELVHARSIEQALPVLRHRLAAIVCGLHFDGSRMFDLLRAIRNQPFARDVPVVCYRDLESDLGAAAIEGLEIATAVMGAIAFVDTYTLKQRYGIPHADDVLRSYVINRAWEPPRSDGTAHTPDDRSAPP
jgi:hypothetical protein